MAIPQDWMPPGMPDAQKDEIAAKHPDDPASAAAEAWAVWANEMPVEDQGVKSVQTGAQSITYDQTPYESAMERARWYKSRSKSASSVDVGGTYRFGWIAPTRYTGSSEAADGDPAGPGGEPWGAYTVTTADVVLTNGSGPLSRSNFQTQEDANNAIVEEIASKADQDHVHADGGTVDLSDYETKVEASVAHNSLDQNITVGLAGKADKDHDHTIDLDGYVTKDEADEAHQELDRKIDAAATGDHNHADYETKVDSKAADEALSGRITQVSQDKADQGHGHIDLETKIAAQESHQDLQDQIDDRSLVSHSHPDATPDLSDYETKVASEARDAGLENQIKQKADTGHTHAELQPPDLTNYVTKPDLASDQARQDQALTEGLADKSNYNHVHDGSDGGAHYELEADAVQRYERTALELSTKADKDHDHPSGDHEHDDLATDVELQTETALRKQGDADLQAQINSAVAGGHDHDSDYAAKAHGHGEFSLSDHAHPEYEGGGSGSDVTKAYVDTQDQSEARDRADGDKALGDRIDALTAFDPSDINDALDLKADQDHEHEIPPGTIVSDTAPFNPDAGATWYDTVRMELFVFADGGWVPSSPLGARVDAGEALQAQIVSRVEAGEAQQATLTGLVDGKLDLSGGTKSKMTGILYMGGNKIAGLKEPELDTDAANKIYVDTAVAGAATGGPTSKYDGNRFNVSGSSTKQLSDGEVMFLQGEATVTHLGTVNAIGVPEGEFDWDGCARSGVVRVMNGAQLAGYFQVFDIVKNEGRNVLLKVTPISFGDAVEVSYDSGTPCYFQGVFFA